MTASDCNHAGDKETDSWRAVLGLIRCRPDFCNGRKVRYTPPHLDGLTRENPHGRTRSGRKCARLVRGPDAA